MLQLYPVYLLWNRRKTLTGSTNKLCTKLVSKRYCILGQWLNYREIAWSFPNRVISWSTFDHFTDVINPVSPLFLGFSLNKGWTSKPFEVRIDFQDRVLGEVRLPSPTALHDSQYSKYLTHWLFRFHPTQQKICCFPI